ncbi:helix-turn-helix domain-containing protein [Streptomyces sp. P38-E01]|uniref:Helix-turn-helix domain-containing protein n=1 Tax=Streptomyces tardus TaxID=2780544 RepID=A0A949JAL0_9ACTN|nr:helix-turn-helix domain-containing protein [Streptomyces tardus]MBU7596201.1 helix-turn-helix domain-containing protein [Streptomyces tardus]
MSEDFQTLIDEVSALLGTPATLENRDFELIAFGAHESAGDDAELVQDPVRTRTIMQRRSTAAVRAWFERFGITRAAAPVRIPADPAAGVVKGRICLPARHSGVVHGYVWLLDEGSPTPDDPRLLDAMDLAARIGALLASQARTGARLGDLLRAALTAADRQEAEQAREELRRALGSVADGPLAALAVGPWPPAAGTASPAAVPQVPVLAVLPAAREQPRLVAALVRLRAPGALDAAQGAAQRLLRAVQTPEQPAAVRAFAGVSAPRQGLGELGALWREARSAARAARAEPQLGPVARWAELGAYRMLTALPTVGAVDPAVARLLEPAHREMARTAEVYLDCAGRAGRTAAQLGIHRQTLYYRLSRVEQLTDLDLSDGEARLLLHMALKSARLQRG